MLEAEGLLVRKTGYAATVFTPLRQEVREYYQIRTVLEPLAAQLALPNVTPASSDGLSLSWPRWMT